MTPTIGLADLIRAAAQLVPRGDDPGAIARILGLAPNVAVAPATALPAAQPAVTGALRGGVLASLTLRSTIDVHVAAQEATAPIEHARSIDRGPMLLRPLGRPDSAPPTWLPPTSEGLDLAMPPTTPTALETLFEPRRHRALISAALATFGDGGPLDLERLIAQIVSRQLPRSLPRLPEATLRRGAWLLLDRSPAMAPFFEDVSDLAARIERVVGRDATRIQQFTVRPDRAWDAAHFNEYALEVPPPGTPLVALTDLGLRSSVVGWRPLLLRLAARGSRAIAIVPYPAARAPLELRGLATVVPWDRTTNVRAVKPRRRSTR